jgi:hypothetical protein
MGQGKEKQAKKKQKYLLSTGLSSLASKPLPQQPQSYLKLNG